MTGRKIGIVCESRISVLCTRTSRGCGAFLQKGCTGRGRLVTRSTRPTKRPSEVRVNLVKVKVAVCRRAIRAHGSCYRRNTPMRANAGTSFGCFIRFWPVHCITGPTSPPPPGPFVAAHLSHTHRQALLLHSLFVTLWTITTTLITIDSSSSCAAQCSTSPIVVPFIHLFIFKQHQQTRLQATTPTDSSCKAHTRHSAPYTPHHDTRHLDSTIASLRSRLSSTPTTPNPRKFPRLRRRAGDVTPLCISNSTSSS